MITPVLVAELLAEGERMPVYVHVIDHPDARVLVDTGLTTLHPAVADMDPRLMPLGTQAEIDLADIDIVVNTHLHFDHCGGNHLFAGKPVYVQRRELDDARTLEDCTIREWVDAPGVEYVPVDGELELLPGIRLVPAPGHTRGSQVVVVETHGRRVVIAGDTAVFFAELDDPRTEGQRLVRALEPDLVWLSHEHDPVAATGCAHLNRLRRLNGRPTCVRTRGKTRMAATRCGWPPSVKDVRRRPTLPPSTPGSTIGADRLSFRVRNGAGRFPVAMIAVTLWRCQSEHHGCSTVSREPHSGRKQSKLCVKLSAY